MIGHVCMQLICIINLISNYESKTEKSLRLVSQIFSHQFDGYNINVMKMIKYVDWLKKILLRICYFLLIFISFIGNHVY